MTKKIILTSIAEIQSFVNSVSVFNCKIALITERYTIDAKSIIGIFSLDLSKPITMEVDDLTMAESVFSKISNFIVKE
ncbi:MAG: HPr family phosphocarrier protein [Clostridia bacterium]